jgi:hypothetical protein
MVAYLTELMPVEVRTAGFSLAYSLATAVFGGFTPAICTWLIHETSNRAIPGVWLSLAAAIGLTASLLSERVRILKGDLKNDQPHPARLFARDP